MYLGLSVLFPVQVLWKAVFNGTFAFVKQFVFSIIILWRRKEFVEYAVQGVG